MFFNTDANLFQPEQQVLDVMDHLQSLLNNEGAVPIQDIENAFDQVAYYIESIFIPYQKW